MSHKSNGGPERLARVGMPGSRLTAQRRVGVLAAA